MTAPSPLGSSILDDAYNAAIVEFMFETGARIGQSWAQRHVAGVGVGAVS